MTVRFYYDLGSPYAYLAATRIDEAFGPGVEVEWTPVLLGGIFRATGRSSWAQTPSRKAGIEDVERRGARLGLPEFVWPREWPNNGLAAMRVATWAQQAGVGREFALAAFFEQFHAGRELSRQENIAAAAERAGINSSEALAAARDQSVKDQLRDVTDEAVQRGVIGVPTVVVGTELFWGEDRLDEAVIAAASRVE
ncbi:MAG: 2-hydroxychromene-2-carboxylate isomerase [Actinobacteria bacterium]|nr:2-hydroxychromene-2-carboxylate isomerase [Actinomycetota bacterium]